MKKTTNLGLSLYESEDKFVITSQTDSLNANMEIIDNAISSTNDKVGQTVLFTEQTLTEEQKAQVRTNIGALASEDAPPKLVNDISECIDITKEYVLPDGYIYRYMQNIPVITYETHDNKQWYGNGALMDIEWVITKNTSVMPVNEGDQFSYTGNGIWSASVFWLKSDNVMDILWTETYGEPNNPQTVVVTAPAGATHVMFASWDYKDYETVLEVVPLSVPSEYSWQNTGILYSDSSKYEERISFIEQEMELLKDSNVGNILKNKKIVYDGDSIAESRLGVVANNGGGYAKLIADITGGTYVNQAVGGGYLRSTSEQGIHSIVDNLENLPTDGDLYCFEGGINDYWTNAVLGTYTLNDFTGDVDKTTVCGALETIFRYALTNFVGKPICFVITHKVQETAYTTNTEGDTFKDYRDSMVAICEKYSIPYYDAFSESGLNGWNSIQSDLYMTANISGTGDGTHPNELGYKRYYVPQLIALFKRILPVD